MHPGWGILAIPVVVVVGLLWMMADLRFVQRWQLRRAELGAQDKTQELNAHFEAALKCRRPMLLLFLHYVIPGTLEAEYALHLSNQGEHERALVLAKKASLSAARRPAVHLAVLPAECMVLLRLGRYEQAQDILRIGRRLLSSSTLAGAGRNPADQASGLVMQEGLLEMYLGHFEAALKLGVRASAATISDPARGLVSGVLALQGRFEQALEALVYEPSTFYRFLTATPPVIDTGEDEDPLDLLAKDKLYRQSADKTNEELAGVFGPAVEIGRAGVFLEAGDAENLGIALGRAQTKLKANQTMEHIFLRVRACWQAMTGNAAGMEADLARTRQLAAEKPASRSAKYETHLAAGRAYFLFGRHATAVEELKAATQLALHPLEKHTSTYWLARASQAANEPSANALFRTVMADQFGSWMEADARVRAG